MEFRLLCRFKSTDTPKPTSKTADRWGNHPTSRLWTSMYHYWKLHRDEFDSEYHRRSNVESVFSALKRKFGESLRSRTLVAQENEILSKAIAYNLSVLIHELYEHGIVPEFLRDPKELNAGR